MKRLILICVLLFSPQLTNASPFDVFKECKFNLEAGDVVAAKKNAISLVELTDKLPKERDDLIEIGRLCLKGVFGSEWIYNSNFKVFVTQDKQALSDLQNELVAVGSKILAGKIGYAFQASFRDIIQAELDKITFEIDALEFEKWCVTNRLEELEAEREGLAAEVISANEKFIAQRTLQACKILNQEDSNAAILNPICRQAFKDALHPDLDLSDATKNYKKLANEITHQQEKIEKLRKPILELKLKAFTIKDSAVAPDLDKKLSPNNEQSISSSDCSKFDK